MIQNYDIKVKNVHAYNEFVGVEDLHPHISVIHYDELPPIRHCRTLWGVYGLFLLDDDSEELGYGSGTYDYSVGSIVCVSPSQIGGVSNDDTTFQRKGWALLFSPELFHGTDYEKKLLRMEFFHYHVNKALTIIASEQKDCETLFRMLQQELTEAKRKDVMVKLIELILAYCSSFFNRQYSIESGVKGNHIVSRLEHLLDDYYTTGEQFSKGLPTVRFCADCLCVAPNYLGDLIRQETGDSANHFIGRNVIRRAKNLLMSGKSVTETAYALGLDFPSHLSRLFNRIEGITPSVYLKQALKRKV
ncbi:helix-turn-helix domain-containing protein [Parabacteroides bouchesdurhonensis]|uniref:helix-turn-helix domain-containing protein n=1 Tax=Parabacteroides bouchesdurhonensis TaxID=1936995 RepID=UPI000E51E00F|nr:helix-turn-helix domain-containing protein [Parabacteroides bouchesdurhonensis]RHJ95115.1 AraC family transcriptional regulator [Bacteroides sp. AM07-16]